MESAELQEDQQHQQEEGGQAAKQSTSQARRKPSKQQKMEQENAKVVSKYWGRSDLSGEIQDHEGPSLNSNGISTLGFLPALAIVSKGRSKPLEHHHLWKLKKPLSTQYAWAKFSKHWEKEKLKRSPSISYCLFSAFGWEFFEALFLLLVYAASQFALPILMPYLVEWFLFSTRLPLWWVFVYSLAIVSSYIVGSIFNQHAQLRTHILGLKVRAALTTLIYRKSLYTKLGRAQTSGMIVNLMSTDAHIVTESLEMFMLGCIAPVQIGVTLGLLSRSIGWFCLIPLGVSLLSIPFVGPLSGAVAKRRTLSQEKGDVRIKYVKEFLTAIRIVKYYAWEVPFVRNIESSRDAQLSEVKRMQIARAILYAILSNIPGVGVGATFFFYGLKNTMTLDTVFSALTYLNMLKLPFIYLPMFFSYGGQYLASFSRIRFFALRSEIKPRLPDSDPNDKGGMYLKNASFAWETPLSIAESRYMDLDAKIEDDLEALETLEGSERSEVKRSMKKAEAEREYLLKIIRDMQRKRQESKRRRNKGKQKNGNGGVDVDGGHSDSDHLNVIDQNNHVSDDDDDDDDDSSTINNDNPRTLHAHDDAKNTASLVALDDSNNINNNNNNINNIIINNNNNNNNNSKLQEHDFPALRTPVQNLKDVTFNVEKGKLTMVVGPVGSGKSTLCMAFLGEVNKTSGKLWVSGQIAYASQEAWILNATIRDNITFGKEYDPEWYAEVIRACALTTDLLMFPASDLTEIGERGTNLSGGQKQRLSVARAMYSKCPIVILDDPFSAVDAHVADHMFTNVAQGMKNAGRTVLLITNQLHFLPYADHIGVMRRGKMVEQGTHEQLMAMKKGVLATILKKQIQEMEKKANNSNKLTLNAEKQQQQQQADKGSKQDSKKNASTLSSLSSTSNDSSPSQSPTSKELLAKQKSNQKKSSKQSSSSLNERKQSSSSFNERKQSSSHLDSRSSSLVLPATLASIASPPAAASTALVESLPSQDNDVLFFSSPEKDEEYRKIGSLIQKEITESGNVAWRIYWKYFKAGGIILLSSIMFGHLLRVTCKVMQGIWLSWWSDPKNPRDFSKNLYLGGYVAFIGGEAIFTFFATILMVYFGLSASKSLHRRMLKNVSRAPVKWFDETPVGRIVTRFSKDISFIDLYLPEMLEQSINFSFFMLSGLASLATGTLYVLIIIGVAIIIFSIITIYYRKVSIQIQRLEASSRAPIFSHFNETLEGAATIRAYGLSNAFKISNLNKIDANTIDFFALKYTGAWFALSLDMIGNFIIAATLVAIILVRYFIPNSVNVGYMVFAISNVGVITILLYTVALSIIDLECEMNNTERVVEYDNLQSEAPNHIEANTPDSEWPSKGNIRFEHLVVGYKDDTPVLKDLSCNIRPQEKVGIVGRTGAGKSTLITALFRTTEPMSGKILIDGVDISQIGLFDLRSKLSIIPQIPQLFAGSIRYNLDPFEQHSDQELWNVLKMVHLKKVISKLEGQLAYNVEEGGSNFSLGQRQLLCMARCLLRKTHILLLDEATAAVDVETEALLLSMIRKNMKDKTVLTVAHRLSTVMDSDRIMVLDKGKIVEFDTPKRLLSKENGIFSAMVEATGKETAEQLKAIANGKVSVEEAVLNHIAEPPSPRETGTLVRRGTITTREFAEKMSALSIHKTKSRKDTITGAPPEQEALLESSDDSSSEVWGMSTF